MKTIKLFLMRLFTHKRLMKQANDRLNDQDFYEKMQWYRFVHATNQTEVVKAFDDVKEWIKNNYSHV